MEMGDIMDMISGLDSDIKEMYIKNLAENIGNFKMSYFNSRETRQFVQEATKKIENFVNKHLQSSDSRATL